MVVGHAEFRAAAGEEHVTWGAVLQWAQEQGYAISLSGGRARTGVGVRVLRGGARALVAEWRLAGSPGAREASSLEEANLAIGRLGETARRAGFALDDFAEHLRRFGRGGRG